MASSNRRRRDFATRRIWRKSSAASCGGRRRLPSRSACATAGRAWWSFRRRRRRGPSWSLRRGEPGKRPSNGWSRAGGSTASMADLLRIATRSRLNMLVVGPERSGKTALAGRPGARLSGARVVTLARHRAFRWPQRLESRIDSSPSDAALATLLAGRRALASRPVDRRPGAAVRRPALGDCCRRGYAAPWLPRAAGDGRRRRAIRRSSFSVGPAARIVRRDRHRGRERRPDLRPSERRRVPATDSKRRHLPGPCTRQATARRFRARSSSTSCDRPPHTEQGRKPITSQAYIWY